MLLAPGGEARGKQKSRFRLIRGHSPNLGFIPRVRRPMNYFRLRPPAAHTGVAQKMIKLTERQLEAAAKPGPKPFEVVVGPTPGLRVSVRPSGAMSWCLRYRAGGRARKLVFARYPGLPLAEARKVAIGLYGQVASGRDPGQERKASRRREVEAKAPVRDHIEKIAKAYLARAKTRTRESTYLEAVIKLSTPWCLHDLRRTCASGMARHGVAPHVVEAVLNHRSGVIRGVASVYNKYQYGTEKREALDLWGQHVERCVSNIIVARPVEISSDFSDVVGELVAA